MAAIRSFAEKVIRHSEHDSTIKRFGILEIIAVAELIYYLIKIYRECKKKPEEAFKHASTLGFFGRRRLRKEVKKWRETNFINSSITEDNCVESISFVGANYLTEAEMHKAFEEAKDSKDIWLSKTFSNNELYVAYHKKA